MRDVELTVTYINPIGRAVVFRTQRLSDGSHPPYLLNYITGTGGPMMEYENVPLTGNDGSYLGEPRFSARIVQTGCMIYGRTDAERDKSLRELNGILNPRAGDGTLVYNNHEGEFRLSARCKLLPTFTADSLMGNWKPVLIDYECEYPLWQGTGLYSAVVASSDRSFKLHFKMPFSLGKQTYFAKATNPSTIPVPVKIIIYGPAVNPAITNKTTNETLRVRKSLASGEVLTITTGPRVEATISGANGTMNAINYVNLLSSRWVKLASGNNELTYSSDDGSKTTRVELYWNDWYLGVG